MGEKKHSRPVFRPADGEIYWYMDCGEIPQAKRAIWRNGSADHIRQILSNVFESESAVWKWFSGVND